MANQQAQNDGDFGLVLVMGLKAGKANEAVNYYREVFGAEELNYQSEADVDDPLFQVLLQFGSIKILVDECREEELAHVPNYAIQLVYEGDPETVYRKALENGGTAITDTLTTGDFVDKDLAFNEETNLCTCVKDPFGIIWTIAGKRIVAETEESSDYTTSSGTSSNETIPAADETTGSNDTAVA